MKRAGKQFPVSDNVGAKKRLVNRINPCPQLPCSTVFIAPLLEKAIEFQAGNFQSATAARRS
jgi:hypothetical protein